MSSSSTRGYLIDTWSQTRKGKTTLYGVGRLETGETFGLIDASVPMGFYVRASNRHAAENALTGQRATLHTTPHATMDGESVLFLETPGFAMLKSALETLEANRIRTYEADFHFTTRYLLEKGITNTIGLSGPSRPSSVLGTVYESPELTRTTFTPPLTALSFDLETTPNADEILAVSLVAFPVAGGPSTEEILIQGLSKPPAGITHCSDERALIECFIQRVQVLDPDILTGWNVIDFDLRVLEKRSQALGIDLHLERLRPQQHQAEPLVRGKGRATVRGRQVLDGMEQVRHSLHHFEDYRLETVGQTLLGRGKTLEEKEGQNKAQTILDTYHRDPASFAEYCLEDSRLVRDLLLKEDLLALTLKRSQMTGLSLERAWGSVEAFDLLYTLEMRKQGVVAPTRGVDRIEEFGAPGGLVLDPTPGLYANIFVFDFKSLYPSLMRTFNIDPLGRTMDPDTPSITAPNGVRFDRRRGILPDLLTELWAERDAAKAKGDALASYTCKIVMNSFYGVLGSPSCRFGTREMAEAITSFGHLMLNTTKAHFEEQGFTVLYGDTDSLFVDPHVEDGSPAPAAMARGHEICDQANRFLADLIEREYSVESRVELEFETFFRGLLLPPNRAGSGGRAKNYGGWQEHEDGSNQLIIKGMEAIRSDWTDLAGELQQELFHLLFTASTEEERTASIQDLIQTRVDQLFAGELDDKLVYRKRIRKPLKEYIRTTPPHVRAARLLPHPVRRVSYLITTAGPEPVGYLTAPLDYRHYQRKQILPIVQTLAPFCGIQAEAACAHGDTQRSLFPPPDSA
ncbi:MAG: DNA polymerase II [Planctomycetota bacterium]